MAQLSYGVTAAQTNADYLPTDPRDLQTSQHEFADRGAALRFLAQLEAIGAVAATLEGPDGVEVELGG